MNSCRDQNLIIILSLYSWIFREAIALRDRQ
jgi:hypothetical protein